MYIGNRILKNKADNEQLNALYLGLATNELVITKDSLGVERARVNTLEVDNVAAILSIAIKDDDINWLKHEVQRYSNMNEGSITIINSQSAFIDSMMTNVLPGDTLTINDTTYVFPVYEFENTEIGTVEFSEDTITWYKIKGRSSRTSTVVSVIFDNMASVIVIKPKSKLFKRHELPYAEIINYNPYSYTKATKTYRVTLPKDKKFGLAVQVGYGITGTSLSPYIGIGLGYNIIKF